MAKIIDMNMIFKINEYLKEAGIDYTLHSGGGCSGEVVELRQVGEKRTPEEICIVINKYLEDKWMQVEPIFQGSYTIRVK